MVHALAERHLAATIHAFSTAESPLRLEFTQPVLDRPVSMHPVHLADHIGVWRFGGGFWLEAGGSTAVVRPERGLAAFSLEGDFPLLAGNSKRDLLLLPMVMLLRERNIFVLHASGAENRGRGVLAVGKSGSGKTTTALSLVADGWRFLGDDMVALDTRGDRASARAFRRSVTADHATLARLGFTDPVYPDDAGGTPPFDTTGNHERTIEAVEPDVLLFPTITTAATSEVRQIDPVEALVAVSSAMGGIMTDAAWAKKQLDAAALLSRQASSYRIRLGRDALDHPGRLSHVLGEAVGR